MFVLISTKSADKQPFLVDPSLSESSGKMSENFKNFKNRDVGDVVPVNGQDEDEQQLVITA
jgi:hypothetical protein